LGISQVFWERDLQGYYFAGGGLHLTPLDMAKFGYLYLRNGTWDGVQIIPKEYVLTSGQTLIHQWENNEYFGYGYQWWTYPDLGVYYASGFRGQQIFVAPEHDLVAIITSSCPSYEPNPSESIFYEYILPAVDSSLELLKESYIPGPKQNIFLIGLIVTIVSPALVAAIVWKRASKQFAGGVP
jgi:CubicO group peptidase (beta-lactamase class C family)